MTFARFPRDALKLAAALMTTNLSHRGRDNSSSSKANYRFRASVHSPRIDILATQRAVSQGLLRWDVRQIGDERKQTRLPSCLENRTGGVRNLAGSGVANTLGVNSRNL